jgi:hypothetical protein
MTVTVAHPALAERLAAARRRWVYADDDQSRYPEIARHLQEERRLATPAAFHAHTGAVRRDFVEWIDARLRDSAPPDFLTTPCYKNPQDNPLFLHFCWLTLIGRHLQGSEDGILVLTESSGLARAIERLCRARGEPCVTVSRLRLALARFARDARALAVFAHELLQLAFRLVVARHVLGRAYRERLSGVKVLVDTYLLDDDLADDGRFRHRYLPGLLEWYEGRGHNAAALSVPYRVPWRRLVSLYGRMKRSGTRFVAFELYASGTDLARAGWRALRAACTPAREQGPGQLPVDPDPIVEWHRVTTALRAVTALLLLALPARLRSAGLEPSLLVEWYEGQPIDRAFLVGASAAGSSCRVIAIRQYVPLPNYLSLYTTGREVEAGAAPRENWVCGEAERLAMATYDSVGTYRVVPALRYSYLYGDASPLKAETTLLIALPYSQQDAEQVLQCVLPGLPALKPLFGSIVFKGHHAHAPAAASERTGPAGADVTWSDAPFHALLADARLVVTTNSSAAVEALCRGKPVIVVGRAAGLTNNPLEPLDPRLWRLVFDADSMRRAVEQWSPDHPLSREQRVAAGSAIRADYFAPPSEEAFLVFEPTRVETR